MHAETPPSGSERTTRPWLDSAAARRANWALALAGFISFSLLYGTQALLPQLSDAFSIPAVTASLSVSAGTAAMAFLLIPWSLLSDRYGRVALMRVCLFGAAIFGFASAFAPDFPTLLLSRICVGVSIAGVPAAAMAYLGEELAPDQRTRAMGLYIAANALGGMSGRFIAAAVSDYLSWRHGLAALGLLGLLAAAGFLRLLPQGRHFVAQPLQWRPLFADVRNIYADPGLPWLFWLSFLIMGAFVGIYNYLGFRLSLPPYALGPAAIGAVFLLYLLGSLSSALAAGAAARHGQYRVILAMSLCMAAGILLTCLFPLPLVIGGLALFTFGYFAVHALASAGVGRRAGARRGLVSALYLSSYYLGGSLIGYAAGWPWERFAWPGVAVALLLPVALAIAITLHLQKLGEA